MAPSKTKPPPPSIALNEAAASLDLPALKQLLETGANPNLGYPDAWFTPLMSAILGRKNELVPKPSPDLQRGWGLAGQAYLRCLCICNKGVDKGEEESAARLKVINLLLEHKADARAVTQQNIGALHFAAAMGDREVNGRRFFEMVQVLGMASGVRSRPNQEKEARQNSRQRSRPPY